MATSKALKQLVFESYNGMNRPAMFWGIPIMPMVVLFMGGLVLGIGGTALLSWVWGLVFVAPFLITLLALRFLCAMDGQYLRRVRFARRRIALNLRYGKPLLLTPSNPNWSRFYGQRFSQQRYASRGEDPSSEIPR